MVVAACPGATGLGDPIVGNGWKKKLFEGLVGLPGATGLTGVVGARGVVAVTAGRTGVVGAPGVGDDGEGDAEG
jgi:hypothetical protein